MKQKVILLVTLHLIIISCSTTKITNDVNLENNNKITGRGIYLQLLDLYSRGHQMDTKKLRYNHNYCINQADQLQQKAKKLKEDSDKLSLINLSISANHLEICTSCSSMTANDHCEWAKEALDESKAINGW